MPTFSVQAVIFDLDGVLVDTEACNVDSAFLAFRSLGHELQPDDAATIVGRHPDDYAAELRELGFELATVTYDSVETLRRFANRHDIAYTLLSDPDSEIIQAFDVLNERHAPGSFAYGIAHPIIFVIDPGGIVRHRFSEEVYSVRTDHDVVVQALRMN